ncbi:MAG: hypothetical protein HZC36_01465 [Armatimonadetes bacterium]|nr:hypothetical protein [Armatimonadota bacterium]
MCWRIEHTYRNDILGNRLDRNYDQSTGGAIYEWDALNRMKITATVSAGARYEYRADGMRYEKVEGLTLSWIPPENPFFGSGHYDQNWSQNLPTTRYYYDGQMAMEEDYNNSSTYTTTRYGIGARGIDYISKYDGTNTTTGFPIYDGHGNMIATIGRSASSPYYSVGDSREYDVWGRIRAGNTTGDPKNRYCANLGHPTDDESGLIYMRARASHPSGGQSEET